MRILILRFINKHILTGENFLIKAYQAKTSRFMKTFINNPFLLNLTLKELEGKLSVNF